MDTTFWVMFEYSFHCRRRGIATIIIKRHVRFILNARLSKRTQQLCSMNKYAIHDSKRLVFQ